MNSRRNFLKVAGSAVVITAVSAAGLTQCDLMPNEAVAAWRGPQPDIRDPRVKALSYALLAPNPHNRQPWIVDLREAGAISFFCDGERLLPETDPFSRQISIGCGAFLELLKMAAANDGFRAEISYFPQGAWPENQIGQQPICRVEFVADGQVARDPLFAQVLKRRTNRHSFDGSAVLKAEAQAIAEVMGQLPVRFDWTGESSRLNALRDIARRAWAIEVKKDSTYLESVRLFRITAPEIAQHRDGLSFHGPFFWWLNKLGLFSRETAMDAFARNQALELIETHLKTPAFGWIVTSANDRLTQFAAGAAYLRANLKATEMGLAMHPLSQALQEFPEMLTLLAEHKQAVGAAEAETVQMFFRLGRATQAEPAPRRPLDAIIRK